MERILSFIETLSSQRRRQLLYALTVALSLVLIYFAFIDPLRAESANLRSRLFDKRVQAAEMKMVAQQVVASRSISTDSISNVSSNLSPEIVRSSLLDYNLRSAIVKKKPTGKIFIEIENAFLTDFWKWYAAFRNVASFSIESMKLSVMRDTDERVSIILLISAN